MGNFFSKLGKSIGKAVKGIANVASVIPGPWQVPAQVVSVLGSLTSKQKNPADTAAGYIQQGADAQMAYQMAALKQQQELMDRQLGTATADKQMAYDINRQQFFANQQNILPYQMASLSALQALPQLQQLLGLQAYNIPQSVAQFTPPEVNYARMYQQTQQQLFPDSTGAATLSPTEPPPGLRINQPGALTPGMINAAQAEARGALPGANSATSGLGAAIANYQPGASSSGFMGQNTAGLGAPKGLYEEFVAKTGRAPTGEMELYSWRAAGKPAQFNPEASMRPEPGSAQSLAFIGSGGSAGGNAQGSTTNQALSAYTGPAYDLNNSPLYMWQKQQAEEALTNQLAAAGLSGGTYAQRELSRQNQGLAAAERERVVGNLTSMVNMGMSGSGLGQSSFTTPQSTDIMNAYQMGGNNISSIYGNLGAIQGQLGSQLAQNYMAGYNAQQQQTSPIQDALALASSYGWLGGAKSSSTPKTYNIDYGIPGYTGYQQYSGMKLL